MEKENGKDYYIQTLFKHLQHIALIIFIGMSHDRYLTIVLIVFLSVLSRFSRHLLSNETFGVKTMWKQC